MEMFSLKPIGIIRSPLKVLEDCPFQENENAPEAWLEIDLAFLKGFDDMREGSEVLLLTWFHLADRQVLKCYTRNNTAMDPIGVFNTRSPDRPNPIGLHQVKIVSISGNGKIKVAHLEALDGTPVI